MAKKTVSDEVIIVSLINNGTMKAAAAAVGISERTIYERMCSGDFQELYAAAKADLLRKAVFEINSQIGMALETVSEIMADKEISPAIRLQAAQTILNNAGRFTERLREDEQGVLDQREKNRFSFYEL
jgi:hypothetical protein